MSLDSRRAKNLATLSAATPKGEPKDWHVLQDGIVLRKCPTEFVARDLAANIAWAVVVKVGGGQ